MRRASGSTMRRRQTQRTGLLERRTRPELLATSPHPPYPGPARHRRGGNVMKCDQPVRGGEGSVRPLFGWRLSDWSNVGF
jgi:hypothetical protein